MDEVAETSDIVGILNVLDEIYECVHFFGDNIGITADGPSEQIRSLEDGRADFAEAERGEDFVGSLLYAVPEGGVWREQVAGAADGLKLARLLFFLFCAFAHLLAAP